MTSVLIEPGPFGKRARAVSDAEAQQMVTDGRAVRDRTHSRVLTAVPKADPREADPREATEPTGPGEYARRDMVATEPRKRRVTPLAKMAEGGKAT